MFNQAAAAAANFPPGATFFIENFTYANSVVMERMFEHLSNMSFTGITVCGGRGWRRWKGGKGGEGWEGGGEGWEGGEARDGGGEGWEGGGEGWGRMSRVVRRRRRMHVRKERIEEREGWAMRGVGRDKGGGEGEHIEHQLLFQT